MRKIVLASALTLVICLAVAEAAPSFNVFNASDRQYIVNTFRRSYDNLMRNFRNLRRQFVTSIRDTSFLPAWARPNGNNNGGSSSGSGSLAPGGNTNLQEMLDDSLHHQGLQRHDGDEEAAQQQQQQQHQNQHHQDGGHRRDRQVQGLLDNDLSRHSEHQYLTAGRRQQQQQQQQQQRYKVQSQKKELRENQFDGVEEPMLVQLVEPVGNELHRR